MKILSTPPSLGRLRNEVHAELHRETREIVKEHGAGSLGVTEVTTNRYFPAIDTEHSVLDAMTKSEFTVEIEAQDGDRDNLGRGLLGTVQAATRHPDAAKRAAAEKVLPLIEHYGNIAGRTYDAQSASTDDLIRLLREPAHAALITTLELTAWVAALEASNAKFVALMLARYGEVGNRPTTSMKNARAAADAGLREMLDRIEAMITLNGIDYTAALKPFAAEWNALADRYKHILAIEHGRRAAKKNDEENDEL
jgi:hypothetical protein